VADIPKISRRVTLQWVAATSLALAGPAYAGGYRLVAYRRTPEGYGQDPDLNHPLTPWHRSMTSHQLQLTAVLSDFILPGTQDAPAPSEMGIPDFIDEWVSAPYPDQQTDRSIFLAGLKWLDDEAHQRWGQTFLVSAPDRQRQILDVIALDRSNVAVSIHHRFFLRLRFLVVGAYYTTEAGFRDIGYVGNVALESYPPPTAQEIEILEEQFRQLGI
jgi:hypothetical protein